MPAISTRWWSECSGGVRAGDDLVGLDVACRRSLLLCSSDCCGWSICGWGGAGDPGGDLESSGSITGDSEDARESIDGGRVQCTSITTTYTARNNNGNIAVCEWVYGCDGHTITAACSTADRTARRERCTDNGRDENVNPVNWSIRRQRR